MKVYRKQDQRWSEIALFLSLGWSPKQIAKSTKHSETAIRNDLSRKGGVDYLFPNKPQKAAVYMETFRLYFTKKDLSTSIKRSIEILLDLAYIWVAISAMESTYAILTSFKFATEDQSYVDLAKKILKIEKGNKSPKFVFDLYLEELRVDNLRIPINKDNAVNEIVFWFASSHLDRKCVCFQSSCDIQDVVLNLVCSAGLNENEEYVIGQRFGLCGLKKEKLHTIGDRLGLSNERIRQIEVNALKKLAAHPNVLKLRLIFLDGHLLSESEDLLRQQNKELLDKNTVLKDENECLKMSIGLEVSEKAVYDKEGLREKVWLQRIKLLRIQCDDIEFSVRTSNVLNTVEIRNVGQLIQLSESILLFQRHFGRRSLREVKDVLRKMDLTLGSQLPEQIVEQFILPEAMKKKV